MIMVCTANLYAFEYAGISAYSLPYSLANFALSKSQIKTHYLCDDFNYLRRQS